MKVFKIGVPVLVVCFSLFGAVSLTVLGGPPRLLLPPHNMEFVGQSPGNAWAIDQRGIYAYVLAAEGLQVKNCANPAAPFDEGFMPLVSTAWSVAVSDTYAYIAADWSGLVVADISDPTNPFIAGSVGTTEGAMWAAVQGHYAYVAAYNAGLRVIDISDPANPAEVGFLDTTGSSMGVAVQGHYVYLADYDAGLIIIDVQNPTAPVEVGSARGPLNPADPNSWTAQNVVVQGGYAYVADWDKVHVIDVSDPANPAEVALYDTPGQAYALVIEGSNLYIADYDLGASVVSVADPLHPTEVGFYDTDGTSTGVAVGGDLVYMADGDNGLVILRFLGVATPTFTPTPTRTSTPTATVPAATSTPTSTATATTIVPTPTSTSTATVTPAPTATATNTASVTPTSATSTPTSTGMVTATPIESATPTETFTATPTGTLPTPTSTETQISAPTVTQTPAATSTSTTTATSTSSPTATSTATATPTETVGATPTSTQTALPTPTPTVTRTQTPAASRTATATSWPTRTPTATPRPGPLHTSTEWVNFYGTVQMPDGQPAPYGAVVDAYDSSGVRCGSYYITQAGEYGLMPVYRDDQSTSTHDGANPGDHLRFFVNGMPAAVLGPDDPVWTNHSDLRHVNLRAGEVVQRVMFLSEGWNLISLDIMPLDSSIAGAFSSVRGAFDLIMGFDCQAGALSYYPDLPDELNTLKTIDPWHGYWIRMTEGAHLVVPGIEIPSNTPIQLCAGYNLAGYLPHSALGVNSALASLGGSLRGVLGFDPQQGGQSYYPDLPPGVNSLTQMVPGRGYWIRVDADRELVYP